MLVTGRAFKLDELGFSAKIQWECRMKTEL